jgi:hypothetical protein
MLAHAGAYLLLFLWFVMFYSFFYHNVVAQGDTKVSAHLNKVKIDTATSIFKIV